MFGTLDKGEAHLVAEARIAIFCRERFAPSPHPCLMMMIARFLIALVKAYQVTISPWLGKVCRFEPSCSRYAVACLERHGALRGCLLSVKRLCKCHPFH